MLVAPREGQILSPRAKLAKAVGRKLDPDLEEKDPNTFVRNAKSLARHFGRLKSGELTRYAAEWGSGKNQEILGFAKPDRGRRAGRHQ